MKRRKVKSFWTVDSLVLFGVKASQSTFIHLQLLIILSHFLESSSCPDELEEDGCWSKVRINCNFSGLSGLWFFKSSLVSKCFFHHRFYGYGCGCVKVRFACSDRLNSFCSSEYLEYITGPLCVPFLERLGKTGMDLLNPSHHKRDAVLQKVQECLVGKAGRGQQRRRHPGGGESHHLHEFFTCPSVFFWGVYVLFRFYCLLFKEAFLNNFPWFHACYKVFSWTVVAGQDSLELSSLHLELLPWLQAVPVQAELLWHRELHGRGGGTRRILWLLLSESCSTHQFLGEISSLM